ncbi:accessory Sec system protein Asp1 [Staphylococcus gallinarum]|uniref:accessory Sec system protein Asp1 n=2 Tax=Staphylococcus gallinarum TaxID=1293 RepID=UPI000D1CEEC4|nr:accessory Sec system protein Asp1 [Staphylococcus gallinarum]MBU7218666.1 accessory Sec system protein Asp1 [Staphylococcus gallinarum]PTE36394.1 accessory Sec system protein Asp1 [Staphylococcus gallinarum]PTK90825.1 accessory Sec system protein Asp1 [Staphylococcus gallinarum]RIO85510.1 accessory Sec system protein Asp1 [Staphylococcus gallinarum]
MMKYFVPAWYNQGSWWEDKTTPYYSKSLVKEFDDMISLMNMHVKNDETFEMLILNYSPDLRTFLHRFDLFEARYWSLFDDIQGFESRTPLPLDFKSLNWPEGTEFVYTPYLVRCVTGATTYSNVYFNQDGYMVWIEAFEHGQRVQRSIFDDRGYLSSILYFDGQGVPFRQKYMTIDGDCILTSELVDGTVHVSEQYQHRFNQTVYNSMEDLLQERVALYMKQEVSVDYPIIIAADERHNYFLSEILSDYQLCYSIFKQRNSELTPSLLQSISNSQYWLVDMLDNEETLQQYKIEQQLDVEIMRITPFDAQVLPNKSSQYYETYIGLWIDGIAHDTLQQSLQQVISYMERVENTRIILLTEQDKKLLPQWLTEQVQAVNDKYNTINEDEDGINLLLAEEEAYVEVIEIKHVPFEQDLRAALMNLRVVIDLNREPDLFLQISCISAGIPQINLRKTDYVVDEINGRVIERVDQLVEALQYFLNHLKNWNYSFAYAIKLVETFASKEIVGRLNRWIEGEVSEA